MALTLVEAAKTAANNGETKRAGVIALYAKTSAWLAGLPFKNIPGNAYAYNQEAVLPGMAFRGINEAYTASTGIVNPAAEMLRIAGGELDVDRAIVKTMGAGVRSTQEQMKTKAIAHGLTARLIKGDSLSDPREFDGIQNRVRIGGPQFFSAGGTQAGDPLSLFTLDTAIAATAGTNKQIWCNVPTWLRFSQAARNQDVGGLIVWDKDEFGRPLMRYNGIALVPAFPEQDGDDPLPFTEQGGFSNVPGGATSTSLYVVGLGDGYLSGLQNGTMEVTDLGELQSGPPVLRTRIEWLISLVAEHPKCITRYAGISNAPFTA
jgi:hypothetical protein